MRLPEMPLQDPFVLVDQATQTYLLYTENNPSLSGRAAPGTMVYQSQDLREWSAPVAVYAVPEGGWADPAARAVAPEVHHFGGRYCLFTTLQHPGTVLAAAQQAPAPGGYDGNAIWQTQTARATIIAVADSPLGPFVDLNVTRPVTDPALMTVDGTLHVDPDGTPWMVFAQEWLQKPDAVMAGVRLTPALDAAAADPIWLFKGASAPWYLDPVHGAPPGRSLVNDRQSSPYAIYGPQVYRTPNRSLLMLWSGYRRHHTEFVQTQALSVTGHIAGPWRQLAPIVTGNKGHGMIFETFAGRQMLILHNHDDSGGINTDAFFVAPGARAELHDVAIKDDGVAVLRHRRDLDGVRD